MNASHQRDSGVIVILGAAGAVGNAMSRELVKAGESNLRLVDVDTTKLEDLKSNGIEVAQADVLDPDRAAELLNGASLLVNCLSLVHFDYVFGLAVGHGIDYTDLISEPSKEQMEQAASTGIVAVPGLGLSPGLSNVLVSHATRAMRVDEAEILFVVYRSIAGSRGALDTTLWEGGEYSPERNYYLDGRLVPAGPHDGGRVVDFGGEYGELEVVYRPHPEPKSLPRNFPTIRYAAVRGTWQAELMNDLRVLNKYGMLTEDTLPRTADTIWGRLGGVQSDEYHGQGALQVEARGVDPTGKRIVRTYFVNQPDGEHAYALTGVAAAVGVRLMAQHGRVKAGVVEPEAYFDPDEYLEAIRAQGTLDVSWRDEEEASTIGSLRP